ncbi:hypothetical protein BBP83_04820 [Acinetobacter celticus]|uniref:Uncharacterized protein n=1 Tax=Acinetobacter celticus TaxID=1891224 RepID=A0A1C3CYU0_9GAMM|nr:hypothetical protein BBP83_04820 [Acinetobacter celticus]
MIQYYGTKAPIYLGAFFMAVFSIMMNKKQQFALITIQNLLFSLILVLKIGLRWVSNKLQSYKYKR